MTDARWPSNYDDLMNLAENSWKTSGRTKSVARLDNGRSGAYVAVIDFDGATFRATPERFSGQALLKLGTKGDHRAEQDRHEKAVKFNEKFASAKIPLLLDSCNLEDASAIVMQVVEGGLKFTRTLSRLPHDRRSVAGQAIAEGLLFDWNANHKVGSEPVRPDALIRRWLGRRIDPRSGAARLQDLLSQDFGVDPEAPALHLNGCVLPNPLAHATNAQNLNDTTVIIPVFGGVHGDLHGDNVLVGEKHHGAIPYFLIDFAEFEEDSFLFFDQAYLETSVCIDDRRSVSVARWLDLCRGLADMRDRKDVAGWSYADDHGLGYQIALLRSGVEKWIEKKESARRQDMFNQFRLARVAAALHFANKRIDLEARKKAFVLAAFHLDRFLAFNQVTWPRSSPPTLLWGTSATAPSAGNWRPIWEACDGFDGRRNGLVLVAGPDLRHLEKLDLAVLGQIAWTLVLDFDKNSGTDGLVAAVKPALSKLKGFHLACPGDDVNINFREGVCWLMTQGITGRPETTPKDGLDWRRTVPRHIERLAEQINAAISPRPIVVLILANGIPNPVLARAWEHLDSRFKDRATTVVVHDASTTTPQLDHDPGEGPNSLVRVFPISTSDLLQGLRDMLGRADDSVAVRVPSISSDDDTRRLKSIPPDEVSQLRETVEIVHAGLVIEQPTAGTREDSSFLHGATIAWRELDLHEDVDRAVTTKLKSRVEELLAKRRTVRARLLHSPGAGGTTVARRIAWDLKEQYPTLLLKCWTANTADRIEEIFHLSQLPVLVVIEAADVPRPQRDALFNELKSRNVKFGFLDIERTSRRQSPGERDATETAKRSDEANDFYLLDPMFDDDARRFLRRYQDQAPVARHAALSELLKPDNIDFRSAFFFGLFAFERDFVHVPEFVRAHVHDCSPQSLEAIEHLAIITRYSQPPLTIEAFQAILGLGSRAIFRAESDLGLGARSLVTYDGVSVRIVHPLVAEEILRQRLANDKRRDPDAWKARLGEACRKLIDRLTEPALQESEEVKNILYQLFIRREPWEIAQQRRNFSELLLEIPTPEGRHLVLEKLCEAFPTDAHFWNHLGRHHNLALRSDYRESERCLLRAIALEDWNDIHYHALGMIYRFELRRRLGERLSSSETLEDRWSSVATLFDSAMQRFEEARKLADESQYPLVTTLQTITETVEGLLALSGARDYKALLTAYGPISTFCRKQLRAAEDALETLRHVRGREELPPPAASCEGRLQGIYGDTEAMVDLLNGLLERPDVAHPPVRRLIAHAYRRRAGNQMSGLKPKLLNRIRDMMEANLLEDPTNASDLRMWFQAARRLPDFSLIGAMDRLSSWAQTAGENVDAYYYLYILHFLRYRQGLSSDQREISRYVELCKQRAPGTLRTRSFEWLAKEPTWCPIVHQSELGWDEEARFVANTHLLQQVEGIIREIKSPQAGSISVGGISAFFVPGNEFRAGRDENLKVGLYVGFSYEGLRAWHVRRLQ